MAKAPAEMMKEFVRSQNFTSTDEVMTAMKDMFKDILQEVMECELADELGYEKSERTSNDECGKKSKNYRNGYSKKTVKTQMGELEIKVPRDRNGEIRTQNNQQIQPQCRRYGRENPLTLCLRNEPA